MTEDDAGSGTMTVDLVVKLGGAAITDKSRLETLRGPALEEGAALVLRCRQEGRRVVVVHGAGSFGHHHAKQYKVADGLNLAKDFNGFCLTRNSVTTLNKHVVESLTAVGLPAVSYPAFPGWRTSHRAVTAWPKASIDCVMHSALLPVFHGDCVLDSEQGCCILSGDTIIQTLCSNYDVKRVVFLTDVDGVYDKPPNEPGASLQRVINLTPDGQICEDVTLTASAHDVTGGMLTKLRSAQKIVSSSSGETRVFVAKIGSMDATQVCLEKDIDVKDLKATEIVIGKNK